MRNIGSWHLFGLAVLFSVGISSVQANGDAIEGKKKFYTCMGCHAIPGQTNTYPAFHVPRIGGQSTEYVIAALKSYQDGSRQHTSMTANTAGSSEQDLQDLAAYISQFRLVVEDNVATGNAVAGKGKTGACAGCHGEDGNSDMVGTPKLARQYETYLVRTLNEYKSGVRKNPIMNGMAAGLAADDIKNIAAYYASQKKGVRTMSED